MTDINTEFVSEETKGKVDKFEEEREAYQLLYGSFHNDHQDELMRLDNAREAMNAALDEAKRAMRDDAAKAPYAKIKKIKYGNFSVAKKWSGWYIVEGFVEIMKDLNLFDAAVDEGVIQVETKVDGKKAGEFLRKNSVEANFKIVEDGKEQTPAVTCPKPTAPFGGDLK